MTILITGASGRTSRYVLRAVLSDETRPVPAVVLLVRSQTAIKALTAEFPQLSPQSFVVGDFLDYSTIRAALREVDAVFHNGPMFHPQETAMGINVINAAVEAGVKHFVYCSVLHSCLTKLLNHKVKLGVEEYLTESGLKYTILQPSSFMQNINVKDSVTSSKLAAYYSPTVLQGFCDLQDLALVASNILLDPTPHVYATYQLVNENCTLEDVAKLLSEHTQKSIECVIPPREKVVEGFKGSGRITWGEWSVDALDRMLFYYDRRGIPGNSNALRWLLGRDPTLWTEVISRDLQ